VLVLAAMSLAATSAGAEDVRPGGEGKGPLSPTVVTDARIGPALLFKSQSKAPVHLIKPDLRVGGRLLLRERWEMGASVNGLLVASEHYRVLGFMGHVRYAVIDTGSFSLGAAAALGGGYDADILHADLRAAGKVAPYYFVAVDGRFQLDRFLLGAETAFENLAVLQLGVLVGYRWPL
jgi:hypothetical protein